MRVPAGCLAYAIAGRRGGSRDALESAGRWLKPDKTRIAVDQPQDGKQRRIVVPASAKVLDLEENLEPRVEHRLLQAYAALGEGGPAGCNIASGEFGKGGVPISGGMEVEPGRHRGLRDSTYAPVSA